MSGLKDHSLGRRSLGELDTLADVALEAGVASLEELLLVVVGGGDSVVGLGGTIGLIVVSFDSKSQNAQSLTPSSIGTEKKSQPVASAMALPPSTPGRYT